MPPATSHGFVMPRSTPRTMRPGPCAPDHAPRTVDLDGDGTDDAAVLYNNAQGRADVKGGGIYAILQDFTDDPTNDHFHDVASGFTVHEIA